MFRRIPGEDNMKRENRAPCIIASAYAVIGALWIYFSEKWLPLFADTPAEITVWGTYKGWFYVGITSILLYWVIRSYVKKLVVYQKALEKENRECKYAQTALKESEEQFHHMFAKHSAVMYLVDPETLLIFDANEAAQKFYGYSCEEFKKLRVCDLNTLPEEEIKGIIDRSVLEGEHYYSFKHRLADGEIRDVEIYSTPIRLTDRQFFFAVVHDITRRRRTEEALRASEANYRAIFDAANDAIFVHDIETGEILDINRKACEMFGYAEDEFPRKSPDMVCAGEYPFTPAQAFAWMRKAADGQPQLFEWKAKHKDGRTVWVEVNLKRVVISGADRLLAVVRDITERKQAENVLRESEARFRSMVEATSDWIWETDADDVYIYSSPKIKDFLGHEAHEVLGRTPFDLMPRHEAERLRIQFHTFKNSRKPFFGLENKNLHKDGRLIVLESSGVPVFDSNGNFAGYRGIDRDITNNKHLEEQLLHAQKMEAVGELAGGIAHDFNNILTAITGYVYILQMKLTDETLLKHVEQINLATQRAAAVTNKLLAFSRKQIICLQPVKINETLHKMEEFLTRIIREDIEIKTVCSDENLTILGDERQIEQVIMNLVTNARDAMPNGGVLTIRSKKAELDREFVEAHGYGKPGMYGLVLVSDTGTGMDGKVLERIFEPFFTTKEVGKGTGLGLAIAYGIVKQHDGYITASSEAGKGATFSIYLPLIGETPEKPGASAITVPPGGVGTILVAEDDRDIMLLMKTLLEEFGYSVIEAFDGEDAVEKFIENGNSVRLLVIDMIMPKKNGREAYEEIKKIRPDVKTIFLSGYTGDVTDSQGIFEQGLIFLSKPIMPGKLLEKVKDILA
jgi:PAS domain S-box-containing protein